MIQIKGDFNTAKVFTDNLDDGVIEQIKEMCSQEFIKGSQIRIMPDVHKGSGCTIGTTMTIKDKVVPNMVGVDIGCGMETIKLKEKSLDFEKLDQVIRERIPSGMSVRKEPHAFARKIKLEQLTCKDFVNLDRARHSIGSLGGGNHFIEVDKDEDENLYLVVHSGSRNLGSQVAQYYQKAGYEKMKQGYVSKKQKLVDEFLAAGKKQELQQALQGVKKDVVFPSTACVSGTLFEYYIHDMKLTQAFATLNRKAMLKEIMQAMDLHAQESFTTIHNYIDTETMILRKGAVSAEKGEKLLIPMNMRDGSLICEGKGNPDWNCSAPHGAGRLMSRTQASNKLSLKEFKDQMQGIYTTCISSHTLDEAPGAYKDMQEIVKHIGPTVEIKTIIKPVYNFKAN